MEDPKDGGPAFPRPLGSISGEEWSTAQEGMSLRDYFAAHAPPVPDWFMAKEPDYAALPLPAGFFDDKEKLEAWRGHGDYLNDKDIKPEWLAEFQDRKERIRAHRVEHDAVVVRFRFARLAKWAFTYATEMVAGRSIQ